MSKITRKQYMAGECTHHQYYAQFVTSIVAKAVLRGIGLDAILNSKDEAFNDILLQSWDDLALDLKEYVAPMLEEAGDIWSLAGGGSVAKAAARYLKTTWEQNHE